MMMKKILLLMMMKKILLLMMIAALVFSCKTKQPLTSTRALETVNVGAAPNDGTGDPLRTAFQKINTAIGVMNDVSLDQATGATGTGNLVYSASPTFTGTVTLPTATSIGDVSSTEIGYLDGVTSAIQTQVNGKLNISDTADMLDGYVRVVDIPAASGIYDWIDSANYYERKINVIDYGADPTGTDYSDAAFASAFASMTNRSYLYVPPGLYKLTDKITIEGLSYIGIDVNGRLQFDANDSAFVFKNLRYAIIDINSMGGYGWMEVPDYSVRTSVAVTIYDCANSEFNINQIYGYGKGIEIYSDRSGGIGNQYNRINFNYIGYCRYGIYFDGIAPYGYNNEIVITGGQIRGNAGLVMDGSKAHAWQNELHNIGFERLDSSGLILRSVRDLQVHNCRWETIADIFIDEDENCDYNRYYFGQTMYHSDLVDMHGLRSRIYGDILDDEGNDIYREMMKDSRDSAYYWTPRVPDARMLNRTVKYADDFDDIPDYLFEVKLKGNVKRYGRREDATLKLNVGSAPSTPVEGMIYGNSTDHHIYYYNGSTWVQLDN